MAVTASTLLPTQHGRKRRYYTPDEVAAHNSADDAWVCIFHKVFDLTGLIAKHRGALTQPLILNAGRDLSHWFDAATHDIKRRYDEPRGAFVPYVPMGRFVHVPPAEPSADHATDFETPWWKDEAHVVGLLSRNVRKLRVVNTLTQQSDVLHVCTEETINEIQTRYMEYNAHAMSYTWKQLKDGEFVNMDMGLTLDQSAPEITAWELGLKDESDLFDSLGIDEDEYIQTLHVYFNDDLTYS